MYAFKNENVMGNSIGTVSNLQLKMISNDYILLNEKEIFEFIKDKEGFIDLINESLKLFKRYFPNAKYYLALEEDYESSDLDLIIAYIVNKDASFEENCCLDSILLKDFVKLHDNFPQAWLKYNYIVEEDDDYYELWRKGMIDNY